MTNECPKCQTDNPETKKFCGDCGTDLGLSIDVPGVTKTIETPYPQFSPGKSLANRYKIIKELGKGGMGEVYLAEDTNLKRRVAIKVLPQPFALDKERLSRFEREARFLASLNHPNIATIHGLEKSDNQQFLVMELIEGETLRERISKGPLPVEEVYEVCRQIAQGLESAHERGIIHRDLKPANIKVTPEGKIKILDFGIAKAFRKQSDESDSSKSPSITDEITRPGLILGTAIYMSPEQAKGKAVDKRSDIWAFGCILFECLTGMRAFEGETMSETIASILKGEPEWDELPAATSMGIRALIRRCLQKDKNRRQHDIADARIEIEETLAERSGPFQKTFKVAQGVRTRGWQRIAPWGLFGMAAITAAIVFWSPWRIEQPLNKSITQFVINLPSTETLDPGLRPAVAISPQGQSIVYVSVHDDRTQLYLREMDQLVATPIPGTNDASGPFFSPDGEWIGFFSSGKLKKISLSGGTPQTLCDATLGRGACWGPDNNIIFTAAPGTGLWRISANGGDSQILTRLDIENDELTHRWPVILPRGKALLFTIRTSNNSSFDDASIALFSFKTGQHRILIEGGTQASYVPTGHLVYARAGSLHAVPFDIDRLKKTGPSVPILEHVIMDPATGAAHFSFSENGSLVYIQGDPWIAERKLFRTNHQGRIQPLSEKRYPIQSPQYSPDGKKLALMIEATSDDVWIYDISRDNFSRFTYEAGSNVAPIWTPDSQKVTFSSNRAGPYNIFWKPADGSSAAEQLTASEFIEFPNSWSPDAEVLIYSQSHPTTGLDIWLLPFKEERNPRKLIVTPYNEFASKFSPDGKWIAYVSDESGQNEVYVQQFPGPGGKLQISKDGGSFPVWAPNGEELFYINGSKMLATKISMSPKFEASSPRQLFMSEYLSSGANPSIPNYDISSDGYHFVTVRSEQEKAPTRLHVILNWFGELKRLFPTGK